MCRSNIDNLALAKKRAEQFTALPQDVGRFHIIRVLKITGQSLGFGDSHINYLELLLSYTRESDWNGGDSYPMVWLSVNETAKKTTNSIKYCNETMST